MFLFSTNFPRDSARIRLHEPTFHGTRVLTICRRKRFVFCVRVRSNRERNTTHTRLKRLVRRHRPQKSNGIATVYGTTDGVMAVTIIVPAECVT